MRTPFLTTSKIGQSARQVESYGRFMISDENPLSRYVSDPFSKYVSDITLALQPVEKATLQEFEAWLDEMREWAASVGYKEEDVNRIIKEERRKKHAHENCD